MVGRLLVTIAVVTAVMAPWGRADGKRAVEEAEAFAKRGDFITAAAKYREAFAADPRPQHLCNVGVAYYKAKDLPRSHRYLSHCLEIGASLDRAFIDSVKTVLTAVEVKLTSGDFTPVDVLVQPPSTTMAIEGGVPFDEPVLGSRRVWLPFGRYRVTFHAEGYVDVTIELDAKTRAPLPASVKLERTPVVIETGSGAGSAVVVATPPPPAREPKPVYPSLMPALIVTGATTLVGISAGVFFGLAYDRAQEAATAETFDEWQQIESETRRRQKTSWVLGGLAGVGAIASGVLWYRVLTAPRVEVQATGSGAAIAISGRW